MTSFLNVEDRNVLLVTHELRVHNATRLVNSLKNIEEQLDKKLSIVYIADYKAKVDLQLKEHWEDLKVLRCDFSSMYSIEEVLLPYQDRLLAVICRSEDYILEFAKIIAHVPYVLAPTIQSLDWTTNKYHMRQRLMTYNPKITPKFLLADSDIDKTVLQASKKLDYPVVIKPTGLAASLLVSVCYDKEELFAALVNAFKHLDKVHEQFLGRGKPQILVEQFMDGDMYSVDAYISSRGRVYACPMVYVKTGQAIGFDDFFGYIQQTPVMLLKNKVDDGITVAKEAIRAMALRNVTAHIEMIYSDREGWRILEVAARPGGFREAIYEHAYGFDHIANDIAIRLPLRPKIKRKAKAHSLAMKLFSRTEGVLKSISGLEEARNNIESIVEVRDVKESGYQARFSRNGGKSLVNIIMKNDIRSKLLADVRRVERTITFEVKPVKSK
ncbi:ATP-grasp domain-containing protein [Candidatus Saccharibacteria bacterium]|jgi:biotin carboxylase|nr:ATP-grasp domain-containing protein [Candidatus Saccharibacteria bacterium]